MPLISFFKSLRDVGDNHKYNYNHHAQDDEDAQDFHNTQNPPDHLHSPDPLRHLGPQHTPETPGTPDLPDTTSLLDTEDPPDAAEDSLYATDYPYATDDPDHPYLPPDTPVPLHESSGLRERQSRAFSEFSDDSDLYDDQRNYTRSRDSLRYTPSRDNDYSRLSSMNASMNASCDAWWTDGSSKPPSMLTDFHHAVPGMSPDVKVAMTANFLHGKQEQKIWTSGAKGEGVFLKRGKGTYITCPETLKVDGSKTHDAIQQLNVQAAMTIKTKVIEMLLNDLDVRFVQINEGLRLQVVPDIDALPYCQKHQCAAFLLAEKMLVVWEDQPYALIKRATHIDDALFNMVCKEPPDNDKLDKEDPRNTLYEYQGLHQDVDYNERRMIVVLQPIFTALTMTLAMGVIGLGWRHIAIEITVDGGYLRLLFAMSVIPQLWLGLFFFQALVGNGAQIFGCVSYMKKNTTVYSGKAPSRLCSESLPHITIQMPVYKEKLATVIAPTLRSLRAAISTYEMQGGTANIFINDDGMQVVSDEEALERQDFYDENNIGWVARPPHNPTGKIRDKPVHIRRGKFKKASNMNFALAVSMELEERLAVSKYASLREEFEWDQQKENEICSKELGCLLDQNGAWADGNIRIGDYILLVDSDTRIPEDCLLEAVSEMEQCKNVAVLQYSSGVMNVTNNFFEKGISFFTNLVYTQIKFAVANGDVAPFVGHNAILRWSAIQEIAYMAPERKFVQTIDGDGKPIYVDQVNMRTGEPVLDIRGLPKRQPVGYFEEKMMEKYWSEDTVSEDFDMALRLQTKGYIVRLGAYQGDGFKEGVSLTVYDELHRWEKYAYGCNELIFHPLKHWFTRGPFTTLFVRFLTSGMPLHSKITILAYIGTYYAIGSAWLLTLANYFLVGWFEGVLDHYYIDSFKVYFSIVCVFTALGNFALATLRYRLSERGWFANFFLNMKWVPLLVLFLGGISFHVSQALLWHMTSVDMDWGATAKDMEILPFFEEFPKVMRKFRFSFVFCFVTAAGMIACAYSVPQIWQIKNFTPVFPLSSVVGSHFFLPLILNPNLMRFTW